MQYLTLRFSLVNSSTRSKTQMLGNFAFVSVILDDGNWSMFWSKIYSIKLNGGQLNKDIIDSSLKALYKKELIGINKDRTLCILMKIGSGEGFYRTISLVQTIKLEEYKSLTNIFGVFLQSKEHNYKEMYITELVFSYKVLSIEQSKKVKPKIVVSEILSLIKDSEKLKPNNP